MPNLSTRTPSFEYLSDDVLNAINDIDPSTPKAPMQLTTPSSSPSQCRIIVTDSADPSIQRVAQERAQAQEERSESPQHTSEQHDQPHTSGHQPQPVMRSTSPGPLACLSHNSDSSGPPGSVHPPPSTTSSIPFGYQPPNGHTPFPGQNVAQAYPTAYQHPGAAYGYQYLYGMHPPPHFPTSSGHLTHPTSSAQPGQSTPPPPSPTLHASTPPPLTSTASSHLAHPPVPPPPNPHPRLATPLDPGPARIDRNVTESESFSAALTKNIDTKLPLAAEPPTIIEALSSTSNLTSGSEVEAMNIDQTTESSAAEPKEDGESASDDDSLFGEEDLPGLDSYGIRTSKVGGRPSKKKIEAADELCKKVAAYIVKKSAEGNLEATLV
ncbi:hypothetical protein PQX77_002832 [Marasmius sp. AFHP31]|nr:hypothetical protein PQX77_002832 [Marasmius sp. AFHP31]